MPIKPRPAVEATATTPAITAVTPELAVHCRRIRRAMTFPKAAASLSLPEGAQSPAITSKAQIEQAVFQLNLNAKAKRAARLKPKSSYRRSAARQKVSKK